MWFAGWESLGRTVLSCVIGYAALVLLLRISGKRTVSKMNAFDLVVTVALGSTLASVVTSQMPISDGIAALATLIALQFVVAWSSARSARFGELIRAQPTTVVRNGAFDHAAMRRERLAADEIRAAVRAAGRTDVKEAALATLETDGTLSIVFRASEPAATPGARDA